MKQRVELEKKKSSLVEGKWFYLKLLLIIYIYINIYSFEIRKIMTIEQCRYDTDDRRTKYAKKTFP